MNYGQDGQSRRKTGVNSKFKENQKGRCDKDAGGRGMPSQPFAPHKRPHVRRGPGLRRTGAESAKAQIFID